MIDHDHSDNGDHFDTRQALIDHMVTTHRLSPTHFRDKPSYSEVKGVHLSEHNRRSGGERREDAAYNHPQHYGGEDNPYETIKVLCHWLTPEQIQGFTLGNAIKYISRAGKKDPAKTIEDLKKARWYLDYEVTRLDVLGTEAALDNGG